MRPPTAYLTVVVAVVAVVGAVILESLRLPVPPWFETVAIAGVVGHAALTPPPAMATVLRHLTDLSAALAQLGLPTTPNTGTSPPLTVIATPPPGSPQPPDATPVNRPLTPPEQGQTGAVPGSDLR